MSLCVRAIALLACISWASGCGLMGGDGERPAPKPVAANDYEESADGLRTFFEDMMQALEAGDGARARVMARSLELDEPEAWFKRVFDDEVGAALFKDYEPVLGSFASFVDTVQGLREDKQDRVVVERFESADDEAAVGFQAQALARMKKPTALYSVRAVNDEGETLFHIWSFVYQDGFFRWIGKTEKASEDKLGPDDIDVREYRVRDAEAAKKALEERASKQDDEGDDDKGDKGDDDKGDKDKGDKD